MRSMIISKPIWKAIYNSSNVDTPRRTIISKLILVNNVIYV